MQYFPAALQELSDQFARLPGIGGKTAQRLAFYVLSLPMEEAQNFADTIVAAKKTVHIIGIDSIIRMIGLIPKYLIIQAYLMILFRMT